MVIALLLCYFVTAGMKYLSRNKKLVYNDKVLSGSEKMVNRDDKVLSGSEKMYNREDKVLSGSEKMYNREDKVKKRVFTGISSKKKYL